MKIPAQPEYGQCMFAPSGCTPALDHLLAILDGYREPLSLEELVYWVDRFELTTWDLRPFIAFANHAYQDRSIFGSDHLEVRCLCWQSGQRTSIHNHHGSSCCVRVVSGVLTNIDYQRAADGELWATNRLEVSVGGVVARQNEGLHQMANSQPPGHNLVTLHVYSPPLKARRSNQGAREAHALL